MASKSILMVAYIGFLAVSLAEVSLPADLSVPEMVKIRAETGDNAALAHQFIMSHAVIKPCSTTEGGPWAVKPRGTPATLLDGTSSGWKSLYGDSYSWPQSPGPVIRHHWTNPFTECNFCVQGSSWGTIFQWGSYPDDDLCTGTPTCGVGQADSWIESTRQSQKMRIYFQSPYGPVLELIQRNQNRINACDFWQNDPDFCLFLSMPPSQQVSLRTMRQLIPQVTVQLVNVAAHGECGEYSNLGVLVIAPAFRSSVTGEVLFWEINCCKWDGGGFVEPKWGAGVQNRSFPYSMTVTPPISSYGHPTLTPGSTVTFSGNILAGVINVIKNGIDTDSGLFAFKDHDPSNWQCVDFYMGWITKGPLETTGRITDVNLRYETWPLGSMQQCP